MKKVILLFAVMGILTTLRAQQAKIGVRAGINLANFNATGAGVDVKDKAGPELALFASMPVSERLWVQPELGYSSFGTRFSMGGVTTKYALNYVLVPLLARYTIKDGITIIGGPAAAVLLSAKGKFSNGSPKQDLKESLSTSDFLGVLGLEYQLPANISVGIRYQHGFTDVSREESSTVRNKAISFSLSYTFGLRKK